VNGCNQESKVMNDHTTPPNNGFGNDFAAPQQLRGEIAKWDKEHGWHDRDGVALPTPMLVVGTDTLLIRWYPEYADIREKPLPNANLLNSAIPTSEWRMGLDNKLEPPWKLNYEIRMIDPAGGKLYTFCNSTWGMQVCFERLNEAVFITRTLRGSAVLPLVALEKRPLPTRKVGMQTRPHLEPIDYREPRGGPIALAPQPPTPQLPPAAPQVTPTAPPAEASAAAPKAPPTAPQQTPPVAPAVTSTLEAMKPVEPIRMEEVINDQLPPWA
jgi:hypothetical protein